MRTYINSIPVTSIQTNNRNIKGMFLNSQKIGWTDWNNLNEVPNDFILSTGKGTSIYSFEEEYFMGKPALNFGSYFGNPFDSSSYSGKIVGAYNEIDECIYFIKPVWGQSTTSFELAYYDTKIQKKTTKTCTLGITLSSAQSFNIVGLTADNVTGYVYVLCSISEEEGEDPWTETYHSIIFARSNNKGNSWEYRRSSTSDYMFNTNFFKNFAAYNNNIVCTSSGGNYYISKNFGNPEKKSESGFYQFYTVKYLSSLDGFAICGRGTKSVIIWRPSKNTFQSFAFFKDYLEILDIDYGNGYYYVSTCSGEIIKTSSLLSNDDAYNLLKDITQYKTSWTSDYSSYTKTKFYAWSLKYLKNKLYLLGSSSCSMMYGGDDLITVIIDPNEPITNDNFIVSFLGYQTYVFDALHIPKRCVTWTQGLACLTGDTEIKVKNGDIKKIKDIKEGDFVETLNQNKQLVFTKVIKIFNHDCEYIYNFKLSNGETLKSSPNHIFKIHGKGATSAQQIVLGMTIDTINGPIDIIEINKELYNDKVYEIKTENYSYITANGIIHFSENI